MKRAGFIGQVFLVLTLYAITVHASDPMALYTRVDKVVVEPARGAPQTIQIFGVFALAKPGDRNDYLAPARGYLYFTVKDNLIAARAEWADLQRLAGTGQIVSLGSRYELKPRLRPLDEKPANPDPYVASIGLVRSRDDSSNPPVRALREFR
jgi:hypothetical protein